MSIGTARAKSSVSSWTTNKRATVYLAATFALSWGAVAAAWLDGARTLADARPANLAFTLGPPLAALGCAFICKGDGCRRALGLSFKPNRWWLVAFVLPVIVGAYLLACSWLLPDAGLPHLANPHLSAAMLMNLPASRLPAGPLGSVAVILIAALAFIPLFTLTEEMGWRGYFIASGAPLASGGARPSLASSGASGIGRWSSFLA
jgi:hypothetical protein